MINTHHMKFTRFIMGHKESRLRGKFIALSAYIKGLKRSHTSNLTGKLKVSEQKEVSTCKRHILQIVIKLRTEMNKAETKRIYYKESVKQRWFFEKINRIDTYLPRITRRYSKSIQIRKIRNKKGNLTTDTNKIQRIKRTYFKNLYSTK